jgi:hypothetical protein
MIVTHFGINNQTFIMDGRELQEQMDMGWKKPGLFFHDAWNEYAVVLPEKIKNSVCHLALDYIITWDYPDNYGSTSTS